MIRPLSPALLVTLCLPLSASLPEAVLNQGDPLHSDTAVNVPEGLAKSDWHSIRAAHDAWQHAFRQIDGTWQARNPGQQWTTTFDGRGFLATPKSASWTWGLELRAYGFAEVQTANQGRAETSSDGKRLTYHWQGGLQEWFVNDTRGLEHGFTLAARPDGAKQGEPLALTLGTLGNLAPFLSADSQTIYFSDTAGASVLNYSGLKVWDADGTVLPSRFERGSAGEFRLLVEETGARYPLTIDPIAQQAFLKAGNNGISGGDRFGTSVAVSGDTVVVGAPLVASATTGVNGVPDESAQYSGAAYVFVRTAGTWSQQTFLKASNTEIYDRFGTSVSISGDTILVGAPEEDSGTTGVNSIPSNSASNSGAAYVFVRSVGTWSQQAYLKASNAGTDDRFGESVSVSADTLVIGAAYESSGNTGVNGTPNESASQAGAAYVFSRSGVTWTQHAYLKSHNTVGQGGNGGDQFGASVSVSGDTLVVGARWEDSSTTGVNTTPNETASQSGAAYVFARTSGVWTQQAYLKASNTERSDMFGQSVAISGNTVVVGSRNESSGTTGSNSTPNESAPGSGAAYVFTRAGTTWSQQAYLKASNPTAGDIFGTSVSISGDSLAVGAPLEDSATTGVNSTPNESAVDSGAIYLFARSGGTWTQQAYIKAPNTSAGDQFGSSLSTSADTVIVGAFGEDSSSTGVGGLSNENSPDSGASYVFTTSGGTWDLQAFLKASNTSGGPGESDQFGTSISISGDTVVVGAPFEDGGMTGVNSPSSEGATNSGAAYVFTRAAGTWTQQAYLKASNTGANDQFGSAVSISGDIIAVGAPYEDSATTGVNGSSNEGAVDSGAVYVFTRDGGVWTHQAYLKPSNTGAGDRFGSSVSASGDLLIVGSPEEDGSATGINGLSNENAAAAGAAYIFNRAAGIWTQETYLKASNTGGSDRFGFSVASSGDTVAIGAYGEDSNAAGATTTPNESASNAGAVYVFVRGGGAWTQQAYLKASSAAAGNWFGHSVAISGDTLVAGAYWEASSTTGVNGTPNYAAFASGAAYVFFRSGDTWAQQAFLKASNTGTGDNFGWSVAVSGGTIVVGAPKEASSTTGINSTPDENATSAGAAYVFLRNGANWSQQAYLKAHNTGQYDSFGTSVAISGDTVALGATGEASSTAMVNGTPNEAATGSGASYIFTGAGSGATYPVVAAPTVTDTGANSATLGGNVTADGGSAIIERGFVLSPYGLNPSPWIGGSGVTKLAVSGTTGLISFQAIGLSTGTTYAFKAFATNSEGTSYSTAAFFTTLQSYQVTFIPNTHGVRSGGGALIQQVIFGDAAVAPSIAADAGWSFIGWSVPFNQVTGNLTVTALYEQLIHSVTFLPGEHGTRAGGGNLIQQIIHGNAAQAPLITPGPGWLFTGWDLAFDAVTSQITVNALYQQMVHTVTFLPGDHGTRTGGGNLVQQVTHGNAAQVPLITPQPGWLLTGWDTSFDAVTSHLTINAVYEQFAFTVIFDPGVHGTRTGGGPLTQLVETGAAATASLITPEPGWLFTGWDMAFDNITADLTLTALYEQITYIVTFHPGERGTRTGGGNLVQQVPHGNTAQAPVITPATGWLFSGWDTPFTSITGDLEVNAIYTEAPVYTVTFNLGTYGTRTGGGDLTQNVIQGGTVVSPTVQPVSGQDFIGWDKPLSNITGSITINALYQPYAIWIITFDLGEKGTHTGGGSLVQMLRDGTQPTPPLVTAITDWIFLGWDVPFDDIRADTTVTALYAPANCLVTFDPGTRGTRTGGGALTQNIPYGQAALAPLITPSPGYTFTGWDQPFDNITGGVVIHALYQSPSYSDTFDPSFNPSLWASFSDPAVTANTHGQAAGPGSSGNSLWFGGDYSRTATTVLLDVTGSQVIRFKIALANGPAFPWENADPDEGERVIVEYSVDGVNFTIFSQFLENKTWQEISYPLPPEARTAATRFRFRQFSHSGTDYDHWAIDDLFIGPSGATGNLPPTAVATANVFNPATGSVELIGNLSNDPDGTIAYHSWSWPGGSATGSTVGVTLSGGITTVTLTVSDNLGATATTTVSVHVDKIGSALAQAGLSGPDAAPDATPFGDGVPNLLKYAFNMNLTGPDATVLAAGGTNGLPRVTTSGTGPSTVLKVDFLRRKGSGLLYVPERATNLSQFTPIQGTQTVTPLMGDWELVTLVESNPPENTSSSFARVRVTLP